MYHARMTNRQTRDGLVCALVLGATRVAGADVSLPTLMGDGCVLQRETDAAIYGFASPGETVTVRPSWTPEGVQAPTVTADAKGMWSVTVSTRAVGPGPHTIDVRGTNNLTIRDVLVGEVWVCSGQSNMEWPLSMSTGAEEAARGANDPLVHLFTVANTTSLHDRLDATGAWAPCTPQTAPGFSGVGYFFARHLRETLKVPVGIISADWGGTRVEAWTSDKGLDGVAALADELALQARARDPLTRPTGDESLEHKWWSQFDGAAGMNPAWRTEGFDDSAWPTTALPANFSGDLATFDGVVCYRRTVKVPAESLARADAKATLSLGPIDDRDEAFVNGTLVGATYDDGKWAEDRVYQVPLNLLHPGDNTIAVAVLDTAGPGGVFGEPGQMSLTIGDAKPLPLAGEWRAKAGVPAAKLPPQPRAFEVNANSAGVLYRGMIAPITRHTISGAIWYQGEANVGHADEYATRFPAMISDWRRAFGRELGFYFVQIAPYAYQKDSGQAALLREAQASALELPHTGMVVTMDVGNPADIHPRDKKTVGTRLADLVLADMGAITDPALTNYPTLLRTRPGTGGVLTADFNIAPGELAARGGTLAGFELAGDDHRFYPATAVINGNSVDVSTPEVPAPVAMRYGFCADCEPTLTSRAGLPAVPFRTDRWNLGDWSRDQEADMTRLRSTEPGFRSLFDGTLGSWTNVNTFGSTWSVSKDERGIPVIHCTGSPTGVLRTNEQFENFVLELEWRHLQPRSNAGLFVWSDALTARGQPFTRAIEVQVMDGMEDTWYTSDGDVFPIHGAKMTPLTRPSGNRAMPLEKRMNPSPLWNHYRVECVNGELSLAVNGKVVTRGKDITPRKGVICLESEGGPIDFRNIRIKELPSASPALDASQIASGDEGFAPLLTDEALSQWDMSDALKGHWAMDDWVLRYDGKATHLRTKKEYRNYEMIADWRLPGKAKDDAVPVILPDGSAKTDGAGKVVTQPIKNSGDSGIYLRGTERSQVNIWCWPVGSGELWDVRNDQKVGKDVRAAATPRERADLPAGQWNRFRIRLVGDRATVELNGKRVIDNAQIPGINERGPILLQHHGDPIEWANIYVRELNEDGR